MTEDAAIRIDCDSAEFVHVPHTWSSSFAQNPRNLSHRILGTSPVSSELDFSNDTTCLPYRITDMLLQAMPWVARCPPDTAIAWFLPSHGP